MNKQENTWLLFSSGCGGMFYFPKKKIAYRESCLAQILNRALKFCLVTWCCLYSTPSCEAAKPPKSEDDLVTFFKRAIDSPPEVEYFIAGQKVFSVLKTPPGVPSFSAAPPEGTFYEGARSGLNYFLHGLQGARPSGELPGIHLVVGCSGTNIYQINANTVIRAVTDGKNSAASFSEASYKMVCQFLNMGMSDLSLESIEWNGNELKAKRGYLGDVPVYGSLILSNELPSRMTLRSAEGEEPYKILDYVYPTPATSLGGFPAKIFISSKSGKSFERRMELDLSDIKLASEHLTEDFFSETAFLKRGKNVIHTNYYSNNVMYAIQKNGKARKVYKHPRQVPTMANSGHIYACLFLLALAFLLIPLIKYFLKKNKPQTK